MKESRVGFRCFQSKSDKIHLCIFSYECAKVCPSCSDEDVIEALCFLSLCPFTCELHKFDKVFLTLLVKEDIEEVCYIFENNNIFTEQDIDKVCEEKRGVVLPEKGIKALSFEITDQQASAIDRLFALAYDRRNKEKIFS